jgi:hypothetical protein
MVSTKLVQPSFWCQVLWIGNEYIRKHNDKELKNMSTIYSLTALRSDLMLGLRNVNILICIRSLVFTDLVSVVSIIRSLPRPEKKELKK